jgi:hypothetical protein
MIGLTIGRRGLRRFGLRSGWQSHHSGVGQGHAAELEEIAPMHNRRFSSGWTFLDGLTRKAAEQAEGNLGETATKPWILIV